MNSDGEKDIKEFLNISFMPGDIVVPKSDNKIYTLVQFVKSDSPYGEGEYWICTDGEVIRTYLIFPSMKVRDV